MTDSKSSFKEKLRYVGMDFFRVYVMILGIIMMLQCSVGNWDIQQ